MRTNSNGAKIERQELHQDWHENLIDQESNFTKGTNHKKRNKFRIWEQMLFKSNQLMDKSEVPTDKKNSMREEIVITKLRKIQEELKCWNWVN